MIQAIRRRLEMRSEGGFSLVEVVVAMAIFALISAGVLHTMITLITITRDARVRQVATNLAAQEIDLARSATDIFALGDAVRPVELNNDEFTVRRTTAWVNADEALSPCGGGGGTLRYKHVQVSVEWTAGAKTRSVDSDTLINPSSRINDPDLGTILTVVTSAITGEGVPGIPVKATPIGIGATLTTTTDSAGCAYFLRVTPNNYTVSLSSPGGTSYVDPSSSPTPSQMAGVVRGEAATVPFQYDQPGTLRVSFDVVGVPTALAPRNLTTTLFSTREPLRSTATTATNPRNITVAAYPDGFTPVAGDAVACEAADPVLWTATDTLDAGARVEPVAAPAGGVQTVTVPSAAVRITTNVNRYIIARSVSTVAEGQPECATEQVLRFDQSTSSGQPTLILPYGSWNLTHTTSSTSTSGSTISGPHLTIEGGGVVEANTVTLDPRPPL